VLWLLWHPMASQVPLVATGSAAAAAAAAGPQEALPFAAELSVREYADRDGPAVCAIWTAGLSQTGEAAGCLMRPLFDCMLGRMAAKATAADGDIGPSGANIAAHWGAAGSTMADRRMFVAEIAGEVVGCCGVKLGLKEGGSELPLPTPAERASGADIHSSVWRVSVSDRARRRGVGQALMDASEAWAAQQAGANRMLLVTGNSIASRFYCDRCGYRKTSACEKPHGPWHTKELPREMAQAD
jgi:ribosomal protein S18 acetylase RimI-like enzyme